MGLFSFPALWSCNQIASCTNSLIQNKTLSCYFLLHPWPHLIHHWQDWAIWKKMGRKAPYNRERGQRRQTPQSEADHNAVETHEIHYSNLRHKLKSQYMTNYKCHISYGSHFYQGPCILAIAWGTRSGIHMLKRASPDKRKLSHINSLLQFPVWL